VDFRGGSVVLEARKVIILAHLGDDWAVFLARFCQTAESYSLPGFGQTRNTESRGAIAAFRQMSYALERSLATFSGTARLRFGILESIFYAMTNEAQISICGARIDYA
jgi:hypothetical protein